MQKCKNGTQTKVYEHKKNQIYLYARHIQIHMTAWRRFFFTSLLLVCNALVRPVRCIKKKYTQTIYLRVHMYVYVTRIQIDVFFCLCTYTFICVQFLHFCTWLWTFFTDYSKLHKKSYTMVYFLFIWHEIMMPKKWRRKYLSRGTIS